MTKEQKDLFTSTIEDMLSTTYFHSLYVTELSRIYGIDMTQTASNSLLELQNTDRALVQLLYNISKTFGKNKECLTMRFEEEVLRLVGNTTIENMKQQASKLLELAIMEE